jgi:hypothetical protein
MSSVVAGDTVANDILSVFIGVHLRLSAAHIFFWNQDANPKPLLAADERRSTPIRADQIRGRKMPPSARPLE